MDQWDTILFTDEFCVCQNTDSRRTFIWREQGTHYPSSNVREIDNYGAGGLMIWAGIMLDGRTPIHVFERRSVTVVRYTCDSTPILRENILGEGQGPPSSHPLPPTL
ncbi:transposable element Tcb2 transposase [Trichonephila clavipes]|nr:transposable element Tcb2 transposase [Trichonephila clavipes]